MGCLFTIKRPSLQHQMLPAMRFPLLLLLFVFLFGAAAAQNDRKETTAIQGTLSRWNNAIRDRDLQKALSVFDSTNEVLLIGSDSAERKTGAGS
jgi:hypothetical protein